MIQSESTRAYIYRVITAVLVVAVLYRVVDGDALDEWTDLAQAVLGLGASGLAWRNTSTKS
jgi:hypothetical protein